MKMPIGQLLAYPVTQCSYDLAAFAPDRSTAALSSADMVWFCTQYVTQASELDDPLCSPLLADLAGLPPAVVVSAEFDVLSPQVLAFVERCRAAGSTVEHHAYSGMFHGFFSLAPIIAQAENAVESATRSYLALTTP